jgi:hypothetical protein
VRSCKVNREVAVAVGSCDQYLFMLARLRNGEAWPDSPNHSTRLTLDQLMVTEAQLEKAISDGVSKLFPLEGSQAFDLLRRLGSGEKSALWSIDQHFDLAETPKSQRTKSARRKISILVRDLLDLHLLIEDQGPPGQRLDFPLFTDRWWRVDRLERDEVFLEMSEMRWSGVRDIACAMSRPDDCRSSLIRSFFARKKETTKRAHSR